MRHSLKNQFLIHGYSPPFRQERNSNGGGVMIYVREDIPCKMLSKHDTPDDCEGIFLELNLRKVKWFLFGGYNPHKDNISNFVCQLGPIVDTFLSTYDNLLLLGDFNSETSEFITKEFCEMYNLKNIIKDPTCYKNPSNPSSIYVMLTNRPRSFLNSNTIESELPDHHKLTISVLKSFFQKQAPVNTLFSEENVISNKITLLEGGKVITADAEVAETMNSFFLTSLKNYIFRASQLTTLFMIRKLMNPIYNIIVKFRNHPSIFKIKEVLPKDIVFYFTASSETNILDKINSLNTKKPTTLNNITANFLVATSDIISPFITKLDNETKSNSEFPDPLKMADIRPIHKKDETTLKENYRPVSILPSISKIFERDMYEQIVLYFENFL